MSDTVNLLAFGKDVIGSADTGGSGSGGHTIEDPSGTDMEQRSNLQFTDAVVADDSTNDRTKISVVREITQAEYDELTPEEQNRGVIVIKDANPVYVPSNNAVSVTADGVKTYATLLNELQALVDYSKITRNTALVTVVSNEKTIYELSQNIESSGRLCFDRTRVYTPSTYKLTSYTYILEPSNSHVYYAHYTTNYDFGDADASVPVSGITFTIYYNLIASPGVGDIDAEDVSYNNASSGLSVINAQDAIDAVESQIADSSDAYSASTSYSVGDYCIHDNTLYRCITACSAASWSVNNGCFVADTLIKSIKSKNQKSIRLPVISYGHNTTATYAIPLPSFNNYCIVRVMLSHSQDLYGVYEEHYIRRVGNYLVDVTVARIERSTQYNNFTYTTVSIYGNNPTLSITTGSTLGHDLSVDFDYI